MHPLLVYVLLMKSWTVVLSYAPTVQVEDTIITGSVLKTLHGRDIDAFQNIPYAEPPIGELRFKPTLPLTKMPKIINASSNEVVLCVQFDILTFSRNLIGTEDCLILNVYVPSKRQTSKPLPVVAFIFGGSFMTFAASSVFFGPAKLLDHDLILVTMNYRLGALGFLSTGDDASPGNYGIWDVITSLQWIRDNIRYFDGNPKDITLYGQSAGAMIASMLMVSPLAKDLFHKAIFDSGSILSRRVVDLNPLYGAQSLADSFWCPVKPTQDLVDCLRKQPAKDVIFHGYRVPVEKTALILPKFVPVVDKHILPDHPEELYSKGLFYQIPVLTGVNAHEGLLFYYIFHESERRYYQDEEKFWETRKYEIVSTFARTHEGEKFLLQEIEKVYLSRVNKSDFIAMRNTLARCFTDMLFVLPAVNLVKYISQFTPTYLYKFHYKGSFTGVELFSIYDRFFYGNSSVVHGDEVLFIFKTLMDFYIKKPKQDLDFQETFLKLWTNFIIHGNPTPDGAPIKWEPVKTSQLEFLSIGQQLTMDKGFQSDEITYINKTIIPCLNKQEQHLFARIGSTANLDVNCNYKVNKEKVDFGRLNRLQTITFVQKHWDFFVVIAVVMVTIVFFVFIYVQFQLVKSEVPITKDI